MKIFCGECGTKHEYNHAPPNFCTNCGSSLGSHNSTARKQAPSEKEELDENETDYDEVPHLDEIELEIGGPANGEGAKASVTLGNILGKPTQPDFTPKKAQNVHDFISDAKT